MGEEGRAVCWWLLRGLLSLPVATVLYANELIAHGLQDHCGYYPSLFLRALLLLDLLIMAWMGALVSSEPLFHEFYLVLESLSGAITMFRDILWVLHIFSPAITLVMLILYERPSNCDSDYKVPTLYGLFYWMVFAFQCVVGVWLAAWSGITEHLPVYSWVRNTLSTVRSHKALQTLTRHPETADLTATAACRSANPGNYRFWVLPLLMREQVLSIKYSVWKRITEQGRVCPVCCLGFHLADAVLLAPGCRHLFHSECLLTTLPFSSKCGACGTETDILNTDELPYRRDAPKQARLPNYLQDNLIVHIPVIPPSNLTTAR